MSEKRGGFILAIEGTNLEKWKLSDDPYPEKFSDIKYFNSLHEAFDILQHYDNRFFDEKIAVKNNLALYIEQAGILNDDGHLFLLKRNLAAPFGSELPSGVYIEIDTNRISVEDFAKETGYTPSGFIKKGPVLDYFLLASTEDLKKSGKPQSQYKKHRSNRNIRPDDSKGLSL